MINLILLSLQPSRGAVNFILAQLYIGVNTLILTLLMLGKLAGETTINGIVDWIKERKGMLKKLLNWPKGFPENSTYSVALAACDGQELAQVLIKARAEEQRGAEARRVPRGTPTEVHLIQT